MKVAIVHDWLYGGGAERVVQALHELYPDAPIYTSYCSPEWRKRLDNKVVTGYLQWWPFAKLRKFLPALRAHWFEHLSFKGYDLVISSSGNGEAMGIRVPKGTMYISYCHTPTHFYWRHYDQYLARPGFGAFDGLARWGLKGFVGRLRDWDYKAAQRPHYIIANSAHIQADIKTYYGRESTVIYPPVDTQRFSVRSAPKRSGFVTAGRQAPMKHTDIIVQACSQLGVPLTVIGNGPDHERLTTLAGPSITFRTDVTDDEMPQLMASAQAFIFASHDDFGITPVEAMAAGTPVIAYQAGGALDYVVPGITGEFFADQTAESLVTALQSFKPETYDELRIRQNAQKFSPDVFKQTIITFITTHLT